MVDLVITAASVAKTTGTEKTKVAGATITAGEAIYLDTATSTYKLADVTTSSATATVEGIALNGASSGQPITFVGGGSVIDIGATLTIGATYVLSASGAIAPIADLTTGDYVSYIGYATATDSLTLLITNTGVATP